MTKKVLKLCWHPGLTITFQKYVIATNRSLNPFFVYASNAEQYKKALNYRNNRPLSEKILNYKTLLKKKLNLQINVRDKASVRAATQLSPFYLCTAASKSWKRS